MKIQSTLNDIEILVKLGEHEDAITILKEFQKETLIDYKNWYEENYSAGEQALHSYYIDKFNDMS